MDLNFSHVEIKQFKTIVDEVFYFDPGLTFVRGRNKLEPDLGANGAGKSSIFDALCWCLYGVTVENLRNPDLEPWSGKKGTSVTVHFKGKKTITRQIDPNKLLHNGGEVSQEEVNRFLGLNFTVFTQTVLLGQDRPLFYDLPPAKKLELFTHTLDLDKWDERSKTAKDAADAAAKKLQNVEVTLTATEASYEQTLASVKRVKARAEEWDAFHKESLKVAVESIEKVKKQRDAIQRNYDAADLKLDGAETELKAQVKEFESLVELCRTTRANHDKAVMEWEHNKSLLPKIRKDNVCPTCGQPIKAANLKKHQEEIRELVKKVGLGVPVKLKNAMEAAEGKLANARKYLNVFRGKADSARAEIDRLSPILAELKATLGLMERTTKTAREDAINPHRDELSSLGKQRRKLEDLLDECDISVAKLRKAVKRHTHWIKGFKDIKLQIVDDVLQELELVTNTLLPESGLKTWKVSYTVEKETKSGTISRGLTIWIQSPTNKKPVKWESWSGGERQRLRVVGALALAEVLLSHAGVHPNLEILDEPTHNLSKEGVDHLCEFLSTRARETKKRIIYIDHMSVESTYFDNIATVIKGKQGSRIIQ